VEQQKGFLLEHDGTITIATGKRVDSKTWKNEIIKISELSKRLSQPVLTNETFTEYKSMDRESRATCKDHGGYVGASVKHKSRAKNNIQSRWIITLDLDHVKKEDNIYEKIQKLDFAYTVHSTHSHSVEEPRLRLIAYTDRCMLSNEYQAIARAIAGTVGIDHFDDTTYDINRLMFWPSKSQDGAWYYQHEDQKLLQVDKFLDKFYGGAGAWKDVTKWPKSSRQVTKIRTGLEKASDPKTKNNIVGAFCRAYDIHSAISEFLQDVYEPTQNGRYTFLGGSSVNGAVTYNDTFMYSNHESDPASQQLCNSFDLVRLHLFGSKDGSTTATESTKKPSFRAMVDFLDGNEYVAGQMITVKTVEFKELGFDDNEPIVDEDSKNSKWQARIQRNELGKIKSTQFNADILSTHDPVLKGRALYNEFTSRVVKKCSDEWSDYDTTVYQHYLGEKYDVDFGVDKMDRAIDFAARKNSFHPIKDLIGGVEWDGVERLDTLFIDYWKTEDNIYYREIAKNFLIAGCRRIQRKLGYKFDYAPVIEGPQGLGKTTFIIELAFGEYYSTLDSIEPARAVECLSGSLVAEISELSVMNASDLEAQKKFMSDTFTRVRLAYDRRPERYFKQCVFVGTTNKSEYLKDPTGNRRWWPVIPGLKAGQFWDYEKLKSERLQIWAEAWSRAEGDEETELTSAAREIAVSLQDAARESDDWEGRVEAWLREEAAVRRYDSAELIPSPNLTAPRDKVCLAEVMADCLFITRPTVGETNRLKRVMRVLEDRHCWTKKSMRFGVRFGTQRGWVLA